MFALARPNVLSPGDLGIQNAIERLYALDAHPTPSVVRRIADEGRWHPYATAACFYLWDSLHNAPA
jgi:DNA-3-methyladenine glycosylase II